MPNPRLELSVHITMKAVQGGAVLGSIVAPIATGIHKAINGSEGGCPVTATKQSFVNGAINGALVGLVAGPIFAMLYTRDMNQMELYDK